MGIPNRQIGWGTEENLLWQISKQLDYLTKVMSKIGETTTTTSTTTSTTTTIDPNNLSLTVDNNNGDFDIAFNTSFTIEWFAYLANDLNHPRAFSFGSYFTGGASHALSIENGTLYWWVDGNIIISASVAVTGGWYHMCVMRDGSDAAVYVNGSPVGTASFASAIPTEGKPLYIGSEGDDSLSNGLFSNFRWNSSQSLYNPFGFTPPTAPLSVGGAGTVLLLLQGDTLNLELTDNSGLNQVVNNGSGVYNSSNPFGGYEGCIQFGSLI